MYEIMSQNETFQTEPLIKHLKALRTFFIRSLIAIAACSLVGLFFAEPIYKFLSTPLVQALPEHSNLIAIHPIEAWLTYLKTGILAGVFLSAPYWSLQLWKFISPGLYQREKKSVLFLGLGFGFLFTLGALFGYMIVFPLGFNALSGILGSDSSIQLLPTMQHTFSFTVSLLFAFGVAFELPLLVIGLQAMGVVTHDKLRAFRKYLIVVALVVAALLTPPDPITQLLMALPLVVLYEIGMLVSKFIRPQSLFKG
jgi:sec-independent protein translocase protein TatC